MSWVFVEGETLKKIHWAKCIIATDDAPANALDDTRSWRHYTRIALETHAYTHTTMKTLAYTKQWHMRCHTYNEDYSTTSIC